MVRPCEILACLRTTHFPKESRRSVLRDSKDQKRGFVLGYVNHYGIGWVPSTKSRKHPELAKMLCAFCKQHHPRFKIGSIMVNSGSSALHVDANNCGKSYIISLGDHTGGKLWQYPNQTMNIHYRLKECDGLLPHITLPYEGERYSVVFFKPKGNLSGPSKEDHKFLTSLGFTDMSQRPKCDIIARKDLLDYAAKTLLAAGLTKKFIGDYKNATIAKRT
jgi:hypothetical protein